MQIHAGEFKGRRIKTVKNAPYRPTTAVVRKSLFDILGNIENKTFLDLLELVLLDSKRLAGEPVKLQSLITAFVFVHY